MGQSTERQEEEQSQTVYDDRVDEQERGVTEGGRERARWYRKSVHGGMETKKEREGEEIIKANEQKCRGMM